MMLSETYTNKGWDFTDTWGILGAVNDGYPYLQSFVTLSVPVVTTDTVSLISNNSATVTYRLDNPGLPEASEHGICWNLSGTPTILDTRNSDSYLASENLFAIDLDSLDEFTLYSVRAYVISETDTVYGESISFTTYKAPVVGILSLSVLDTASVTVTSEIENVGYPEISRHGFAWKALSDSDDFHVINLGNTGSIGEFSSGINGLAPNTEYAIYAFAENYCAIVYTDTITFTTLGLPVVTTLSIMEINTAEVTIEAYINDTGNPFASQHGFCWSTDIDPSIEDMKIELGAIDSTGNFLTTIDSLLQNTTYYVCAFATNDLGTVYGDTISFRTLGFATICGMSVSNIDTTSATLSAEILSLGNPRVNEHGFIWKNVNDPDSLFKYVLLGAVDSIGTFDSDISGLFPNTDYAIAAFAINANDTAHTDTSYFKTLGLPAIEILSVTEIDTGSASVSARFSSLGNPHPSQYGVCWSTGTDPTIEDNKLELGARDSLGDFSAMLNDLDMNTHYYVRAYAVNDAGMVYSDTLSFVTLEVSIDDMIPDDFCLSQNYPNPFNPTTTLLYGLPEDTDVHLTIFSIMGRKVKNWEIAGQEAGWHKLIWDGSDMHGNTVSTGVYIYTMKAGNFIDTRKMVFMK